MEIFSKDTIKKILKNRKILEKKLKVKLQIKNYEVLLDGEEINVYVGGKVLEALERNFSINTALLLLKEDCMMEDISIRSVTKKKLSLVKARIIGTEGKTLKMISELSDCHISLHDNTVSIIGPVEKVKEAETAIKSLISGSKQSNVYNYLERQRKKPAEKDLGLKIKE